jgi:uncharacterized Zn-finger protein
MAGFALSRPTTSGSITMAQEQETIIVTSRTVACDGGGGALGHPKTFYTIGEAGSVVCGYCGQRFELDPDAPTDHGH